MGLNFYYYDGLQPNMRVGMIKELEGIQFKTRKKSKFARTLAPAESDTIFTI